MTAEEYALALAMARRWTASQVSAEDILHDALIVAARAGRLDFASDANRGWLHGVIRNTARQTSRADARRSIRNETFQRERSDDATLPAESWSPTDESVRHLPRSARSVLALALHGLGRAEICAALDLAPTAFRQRLVTLRKALSADAWDGLADARGVAAHRSLARTSAFDVVRLRKAAIVAARRGEGIAAHDPDGHVFFLGKMSR